MVIPGTERTGGCNNRRGIVGHHAHLFQIDSVRCQGPCQMIHVGVARSARENLVTYHEHRCCGVWHCTLLVVRAGSV